MKTSLFILILLFVSNFSYAEEEQIEDQVKKKELTLIQQENIWKQQSNSIILPRKLAHNDKLAQFIYRKDAIYKYIGIFEQYAFIRFGKGESVSGGIYINNPKDWYIKDKGNSLLLFPISKSDKATNMLVLTNKRSYQFILESKKGNYLHNPDLVFETQFIYPENKLSNIKVIADKFDSVDRIDFSDLSKYNFQYSYTGPRKIAPVKIFDDQKWTYFEFNDKNSGVPAIFYVDSKGYEGLVNFRTIGDYIVVERLSETFTLRHGTDTICVFNDRLIKQKAAQAPVQNAKKASKR